MDEIKVRIKNPTHPHYPKTGIVKVKNGLVDYTILFGKKLFTIMFDDGLSGMATHADCELISSHLTPHEADLPTVGGL